MGTNNLPLDFWDYSTSPNDSELCPLTLDTPHFNSPALLTLDDTPEPIIPATDWLIWPGISTQGAPPLVKHSMETMLRVHKTWPHMLAKGLQAPPVLHIEHTASKSMLQPMMSCLAVAQAWAKDSADPSSIQNAIFHNMRAIFQTYRSLDEQHLLSALQALVFYQIMLMYPSSTQLSLSLVDPAVFLCLQKVVAHVARTGLMLSEEHEHVTPTWESWVHVTSKRRAVLSLYNMHWSYAVYHDLDSFACAQLGFMLAPAPKFLWQCTSKWEWESLYGKWLEQWGGAPYMMSEFPGIQPGTGLDRRTEMWLEDTDELGIMFLSIVGATERGRVSWDSGRGIAVLE